MTLFVENRTRQVNRDWASRTRLFEPSRTAYLLTNTIENIERVVSIALVSVIVTVTLVIDWNMTV